MRYRASVTVSNSTCCLHREFASQELIPGVKAWSLNSFLTPRPNCSKTAINWLDQTFKQFLISVLPWFGVTAFGLGGNIIHVLHQPDQTKLQHFTPTKPAKTRSDKAFLVFFPKPTKKGPAIYNYIYIYTVTSDHLPCSPPSCRRARTDSGRRCGPLWIHPGPGLADDGARLPGRWAEDVNRSFEAEPGRARRSE